jgi:Iap family predicted aminopeptidase
LTKNVGGEVEAESTTNKPDKAGECSGKILIRRVPTNVEDVIETRIAVVGNGKSAWQITWWPRTLTLGVKWMLGRVLC